jgi:hypothetical protein
MKQIFCVLMIYIFQTNIYGQENFNLKLDTARGLKEYELAKIKLDKIVEDYDGEHKKELKEELVDIKKHLKRDFKNFYFNDEYDSYLGKIIEVIRSKNPILEKVEIRPFFCYDESINASMAFYGTMRVHLGLFDIIENESQLAMVIAHEISHYTRQHSIKSFGRHFEIVKSDENKQEFREAKREGIDRVDRVEEYFKTRALISKKHSREHESEADSFGLELLKNTPYALDEAITGISCLKKGDTEFFNMDILLRDAFHNSDIPFNQAWLKKPNSIAEKLKYKLSPELKDSLSSHPGAEIRYEKLKAELAANAEADIVEVSFETFEKMKKDFRREIVNYLVYDKQYAMAMYYILKYKSETLADQEILRRMVDVLDKMKNALDSHTLGKYVPTRNPNFPPQFNNLLIFIDQLNVDDFETIKNAYKKNLDI